MSWYKTWWGVTILVILTVAGVLTTVMAVLIFQVSHKLKNGSFSALEASSYAGFSRVQNTHPSAQLDYSLLERPEAPFLGSSHPKIKVVVFMDFKCPNCRAESPILTQMMQKYGNQVQLIVRHFPVESTHPGATQLSQMAWCAKQQNAFWGLYNWLFANQDVLPEKMDEDRVAQVAEANGLNTLNLQKCLNANESRVGVNQDYADGIKLGVRGTPTFFVNGEKVEGAVPLAAWEAFLKDVK